MAEKFQSLERDEQGYATANALLAVVSAMRADSRPQERGVLLRGPVDSDQRKPRFESVIDAANRANVSIYPMDAAGLRTESTTAETQTASARPAPSTLGRDPTSDAATGR